MNARINGINLTLNKNACLGGCGVYLFNGHICPKTQCKRKVVAALSEALKKVSRLVAPTPQPMRVPLLAAAMQHELEVHAQPKEAA